MSFKLIQMLFLMIATSSFVVAGQVLLVKFSRSLDFSVLNPLSFLGMAISKSLPLLLSGLCYIVGIFLYIVLARYFAFSRLSLMLIAIIIILTFFADWIFFTNTLPPQRFVGAIIMMIGLAVLIFEGSSDE